MDSSVDTINCRCVYAPAKLEENEMVYEVCVVQVDKDDQPTKVLVQPTVVLVKDEHAATVAGARMVEGEPAANSIKVLVRAFR